MSSDDAEPSTANSAWGGRFTGQTAAVVEAMNASVAFDQILALEDIAGSVAHARMLRAQGLIAPADHDAIEAGLVAIAAEVRAGTFAFTVAREDVHMNVEGALADRIGRAAGRLHTGRSRNDQVATDLRLWLRRETTALAGDLAAVVSKLTQLATLHTDTFMPGYTHLQRAQPITFGHHLMAYAAMFLRDLDRVLDARDRGAELPLGSGALAGSPLPLDRERVARELGFASITLNSLDGVSDRDAALETLSTLSIAMVHVSRLAEEMVLWASQEFGFIELADGFCTGSSLMPQKKNPDIPELLRGKAGRVFGALQSLLVVMKGLPLAYNKDMQEDKEPVFDAVETARTCLGILPALLDAMTVKADRMLAATRDGMLLATDLADYLVSKGLPFREAHHAVGALVATALSASKRLEDLDLSELRTVSAVFDDDVFDVLDIAKSVARRNLPGAPAPSRVREAVDLANGRLAALVARLETGGPCAIERALHAGTPLPPPLP